MEIRSVSRQSSEYPDRLEKLSDPPSALRVSSQIADMPLVAIPAVIAFNYFSSQVKKSAADTEQLVRIFLGFLAAKPTGEEN